MSTPSSSDVRPSRARVAALAAIMAAAVLPYATSAIEFEFAQPEFSRRAMLRLESRIEGMDRDWVAAGRDSRRELTGVRDGNYTLQVRAVAETGVDYLAVGALTHSAPVLDIGLDM